VGGVAAQIAHLAQVSRRPGAELRILRLAGGPHPGMSSVINIFDFPDDQDPSLVYLEKDTGIQEVTRADEVSAYRDTFTRVRDAALPPPPPAPTSTPSAAPRSNRAPARIVLYRRGEEAGR
jgi:Domain of unknown function (DUF5753)